MVCAEDMSRYKSTVNPPGIVVGHSTSRVVRTPNESATVRSARNARTGSPLLIAQSERSDVPPDVGRHFAQATMNPVPVAPCAPGTRSGQVDLADERNDGISPLRVDQGAPVRVVH